MKPIQIAMLAAAVLLMSGTAQAGAGAKTITTDPGVRPTFEDDAHFDAKPAGRDLDTVRFEAWSGGRSADSVTGSPVFGPEGSVVGFIADLAIDEQGVLETVMVDVAGTPELPRRTVEVEPYHLVIEQGAGGEFVTSLELHQLQAMPSYVEAENADVWGPIEPDTTR